MSEYKKTSAHGNIDRRATDITIKTIRQFNMVDPGDSILISISGGPDSVFLTHILCMLRDELNLDLYGFSLDHSTRKDQSGRDLAFVRDLYSRLNIRLFSEKIDAVKWCRANRLSFQAGARMIRKDRLQNISKKYNINKIALGHNLDDNIETFLMRLIRGSGARGLSGIRPVDGKIIRPLINTSRKDIEDYLGKNSLLYCIDKSNLENKYFRNRIRNKLIPFIKDNFLKSFKLNIRRSMEILRDEDIFLRKYSLNLLEQIASFHRRNDRKKIIYLKIPIEPLNLSSLAIRRRIIACALEKILDNLEDINFRNIEDILKLLNVKTGENKWLKPIRSAVVLRINGFIHMANIDFMQEVPGEIRSHILGKINKTSPGKIQNVVKTGTGPVDMIIEIDGETELEDFSMTVRSQLLDFAGDYRDSPDSKVFLDYNKIVSPVGVRRWKDGDRFYPLGAGGSKKLQDFFTDRKIPVNKRKNIPVFYDREKIIWVGNMRIDNRVRITPGTSRILYLELFEK
ncbi:MAG: tRNA lysidine(34) synthetase TilS [Actinomycetia bacterium]|nr:tRNA lysidine(34) synthetase TilS [Actinomycetes bacterium]